MTKIKLLSVLGLLSISLVGCSNNKGDLARIKSSGFLNVGITIYEPMDYFDEDGETIIGFDAELANSFAKSLDVETRFTIIKWDSKILELNSKKIDLIWNGMTITDELKQNIDLSLAYATNYQCVVTKTENLNQYVNDSSLNDKRVAVEQGSAGESAGSSITNLVRVTSQEGSLLEVKAGTSDCAIIDITMANSVVGKGDFTGLSIIDPSKISFDKEDFGIGIRKNSDLTKKLDEFLKQSYSSGTLSQLSQKYNVTINEDSFK